MRSNSISKAKPAIVSISLHEKEDKSLRVVFAFSFVMQ